MVATYLRKKPNRKGHLGISGLRLVLLGVERLASRENVERSSRIFSDWLTGTFGLPGRYQIHDRPGGTLDSDSSPSLDTVHEGILQRLSGTDKLLWLIQPTINKYNLAQFGPYAYRSSAAQFYNLIWPICLGFWWLLFKTANLGRGHRIGKSPYPILMPCTILMVAAPIISTSRGGAIVSVMMMVLCLGILVTANRGESRIAAYSVITIMITALGMAGYLGWDKLEKRLQTIFQDTSYARQPIWDQSKEIIRDNPYWGTGPKSFGAVYQMYTQPMSSDASKGQKSPTLKPITTGWNWLFLLDSLEHRYFFYC